MCERRYTPAAVAELQRIAATCAPSDGLLEFGCGGGRTMCTDAMQFLKIRNARLSYGNRWLVWDKEWVVYGRFYGQRKTRTLVCTSNLVAALSVLGGDEWESDTPPAAALGEGE